jgi:hypothetical protein
MMTSPSSIRPASFFMNPRMLKGRDPMCIGEVSLSQNSRPAASKMPQPMSSDSRMMLEFDMR